MFPKLVPLTPALSPFTGERASRPAGTTLADNILDRLVHNAHRIEMRGESMRKKRGKEQ